VACHNQEEDSLSKKILSEVTYDLRNDTDALPQSVLDDNPVRGQAGIDELYRRHHLYLHTHFTWSFSEAKTENFCAVFHGLPCGFRNDFMTLLPASKGKGEFRRGKLLACDDKQAVLVEDVQLRKNPDVSLFRNVISAVRLTLLDFCKSGTADERLDQFFYPIIKSGFREIDREECFVSKLPRGPVLQSEPINQVVEGGSQIVETIANHQRKRWIDWLTLRKPDDDFLPVRLVLESDGMVSVGIAANQQLQGGVNITEMIFCSANFCANAH
jgi:hypothetical protein